VRSRNAILEALEVFRELHSGITLTNMMTFLYVCENEGLTLLDLASVSDLYLATASRTIRAFLAPDAEAALYPALNLVRIVPTPRGKTVCLSDAGRAFRDLLDEIISAAHPIRTAAERSSGADVSVRAAHA